ncbi:MAG: LamG domain-containing protein [Myxococcales bacterium]|nr:LamG domain-containing protein [Myxococcales bacterium]
MRVQHIFDDDDAAAAKPDGVADAPRSDARVDAARDTSAPDAPAPSPLCSDPALRLMLGFDNSVLDAVNSAAPLSGGATALYNGAVGAPPPGLSRELASPPLEYPPSLLDNLGEATISLWVAPSYDLPSYNGSATLLHMVHGALSDGTQLVIKHQAEAPRRIPIYLAGLDVSLPESSLPKDKLSHIVFVWSTQQQKAWSYLDGSLAATASGDVPSGVGKYLRIGGSTNALPGVLDSVMIFARALSATEVGALYRARCP